MKKLDRQTRTHDEIVRAIGKSTKPEEAYVDSLASVFESFAPKSGDVANWELNDIAKRARDLLRTRSSLEILYAVKAAQWMVQQPVYSGDNFMDQKTSGERLDHSLPRILYARRRYFDLESLEDLPNATWAEVFAALALAYVGVTDRGGSNRIREASEAQSFAEELARVPDIERNAVSQHQRAKAQKGHAARKALKQEAIDYVLPEIDSGHFRSVRHGVKSFVNKLPEDKRKLFNPNNIERTLRDAIYEHRKRLKSAPY